MLVSSSVRRCESGRAHAPLNRRTVGTLLCVGSACSYGATGIFGKLAYDEGLSVAGLLAGRFTLAAIVMWGIVLLMGPAYRPAKRAVLAGVALGAAVYAAQTGFFFWSITRIDASLAVLLVYIAPVLVAVGAVAFGRETLTRGQLVALPVALAGTALVAIGNGVDSVDALGILLAFGCAVAFAVYMLTSHAVVGRMHPVPLSASVCTGCAISFLIGATVQGTLPTDTTGTGWLLIGALALLSTVIAITALAAGTERVGPSTATILSTFEPVVATILAFLVLDERLSVLQVLGGLLVLASVPIVGVQWGGRHRVLPDIEPPPG